MRDVNLDIADQAGTAEIFEVFTTQPFGAEWQALMQAKSRFEDGQPGINQGSRRVRLGATLSARIASRAPA